MSDTSKIADAKREVEQLAARPQSAEEFMKAVAKLLHDRMLRYNWVGFYMLEQDARPAMLALGAFEGAMTPHTRIPLNQGICGAAASIGKTVVVDDVTQDSRYLACSIETKSEIVVPIFVNGKVVGELDIDSHFSSAFAGEDREFVEYCAELVGRHLEKVPA